MSKFLVEVSAEIEEEKKSTVGYSSYNDTIVKQVNNAHLYEAISKYLQVKGFTTQIVKVTAYIDPNEPNKEVQR